MLKRGIYMKNDIKKVLPELKAYLKSISFFADFPVCCQESSLILYMWLKKKGFNCKLIVGYHEDKVEKHPTFHCWVETEDIIVDGTAVQFLLENYDKTYTVDKIVSLSEETNFVFKKNNICYTDKVEAYISEKLDYFINDIIYKTNDSFEIFINEIKLAFEQNNNFLKIEKANMLYSSLCKIDMLYYNLTKEEFLSKFVQSEIVECYTYEY
jgi:hypothetical protein